jgi:subtilisin family serine protease
MDMFHRVSLQTNEFSWKKALTLAVASRLAYLKNSPGVIHVATQTWGFDHCTTFNVANTQGFVAWDSNIVLVSFRGTESVGDWLSNLTLIPTTRSYGRVHLGFFKAFEVVRTILSGILDDAAPANKKVWFTGHSLGGALAMVAGAELAESLPTSGFYTYGQPKTGNSQVRLFFGQRFNGKFHRFVNDDDVVPQVPPGYSHVGQLTWFDGKGGLKRFEKIEGSEGAEMESIKGGPQPHEMNEPEFLEFQRELNEIKAVSGGETEAFERTVEGIFPSVRDHDLGRYISQIQRYAIERTEVDATLKQAIAENLAAAAGMESATRSTLRSKTAAPVLLRVKNADWKPPGGIKVQSRMGNILTARASISQIQQLKQDRNVISIESSREGGVAELANSLPFVHAADVHVPPVNERGDSALVAVIDTGVDVLHEAFRDAAGQTRIVAIWNQKGASDGAAPGTVDPVAYTQSYGRLYQATEIQQMIDGQVAAPPSLRDPLKHGTHVASIAAGRAAGPFSGGLAPEARIIVVIPDMVTEPGDPRSLGYSNSHVDALSFIRATAEKIGLPVAVNVSLGMNAGAHDGSSTLEAGFDAFSGMGRDPGFVVIKSAGNERGHKGHAAAVAMQGGISQIVWTSSADVREQDYIEVWFDGFDDIAFTLIDPAGNRSGTVSSSNLSEAADLGGNHCQLSLTRLHRDNGDNLMAINILSDTQLIQPGEWRLEMNGLSVPGGGQVHAWVERDNVRGIAFGSGDNDEMTLSIPGTALTVITVAACESAEPLRLTDSSSWGLTRDGRSKPDLCAPGKEIAAAGGNADDHRKVISLTGTSMAAPHVTGAVALLMSRLHKNPGKAQVNARQVQSALVRTSRNFSGHHNKGFGFGALNVRALIHQF